MIPFFGQLLYSINANKINYKNVNDGEKRALGWQTGFGSQREKKRTEKQERKRLTGGQSNKERDHKTLTERENIEMSKLFKVMLSQWRSEAKSCRGDGAQREQCG